MYKIVYETAVVKSLQRLPKDAVRHFREKIELIARNPYASLPFVKRLKGSEDFRFRFGDYRAVYRVQSDVLTVVVLEVANRKDIYRR